MEHDIKWCKTVFERLLVHLDENECQDAHHALKLSLMEAGGTSEEASKEPEEPEETGPGYFGNVWYLERQLEEARAENRAFCSKLEEVHAENRRLCSKLGDVQAELEGNTRDGQYVPVEKLREAELRIRDLLGTLDKTRAVMNEGALKAKGENHLLQGKIDHLHKQLFMRDTRIDELMRECSDLDKRLDAARVEREQFIDAFTRICGRLKVSQAGALDVVVNKIIERIDTKLHWGPNGDNLHDRIHDFLLKLEWSSRPFNEDMTTQFITCPVCGRGKIYGHATNCKLGDLLARVTIAQTKK